MFAGSTQSTVCHLVESNTATTVCGLRVSTHVRTERSGSRLHLLTSKPFDCRICKHCRRMYGEADLIGQSINDVTRTVLVNLQYVDDFVSGAAMLAGAKCVPAARADGFVIGPLKPNLPTVLTTKRVKVPV